MFVRVRVRSRASFRVRVRVGFRVSPDPWIHPGGTDAL